ncbi:hypothetical protein EJ08DRAFT_721458 [Tothia fuscella]|uniref:Uncharacterized protein n=1 Tax=Tothia fuscella TaxID=1048955 RepID=A0A9P4TWI0_9PEZI|nr:hypothetical protein EJ08DRAFT_721458 [Tothia fuscella]
MDSSAYISISYAPLRRVNLQRPSRAERRAPGYQSRPSAEEAGLFDQEDEPYQGRMSAEEAGLFIGENGLSIPNAGEPNYLGGSTANRPGSPNFSPPKGPRSTIPSGPCGGQRAHFGHEYEHRSPQFTGHSLPAPNGFKTQHNPVLPPLMPSYGPGSPHLPPYQPYMQSHGPFSYSRFPPREFPPVVAEHPPQQGYLMSVPGNPWTYHLPQATHPQDGSQIPWGVASDGQVYGSENEFAQQASGSSSRDMPTKDANM